MISVVSADQVGDFLAWAAKYGKGYSDNEEFQKRFEVFLETERQMQDAIQSGAVNPWQLGHNKFSDRRHEEISNTPRRLYQQGFYLHLNEKLLTEKFPIHKSNYNVIVDHCSNKESEGEGACNEIMDQGDCLMAGGSFTTVAAIEAQSILQPEV